MLHSVLFTGMMKNHIILAPSKKSHADNYCTQTEMRNNYKPILKAELLGKNSRYGCNKLHGVAARGIGKFKSLFYIYLTISIGSIRHNAT